jgi:very-short-patch-repair endonuclease
MLNFTIVYYPKEQERPMPRNPVIPYNSKLKDLARQLRKNPTHAEKLLWISLRRKQLGHEFHRQVPIDQFIVDFYCHELRLAIEIDGISHDSPDTQKYDVDRQKKLEDLGVRFLRFRDELVKENPDAVVKQIQVWIANNSDDKD